MEDEVQSAARARVKALARAIRPGRPRGGHDTGDGDPCPLDRNHGRMLFMTGGDKQYCPHQSHDGAWSVGGSRHHEPRTPSLWPKGSNALAAEVADYHANTAGEAAQTLPDLDIDLGGL